MQGTGTREDPFIITSVADWNSCLNITDGHLKHYALGNDINAGGASMQCLFWSKGAIADSRFQATFDGLGHTISNAVFVPTTIGTMTSSASAIFWGFPNAGAPGTSVLKNITFNRCDFQSSSASAFSKMAALMYTSGEINNVQVYNCNFYGTTYAAIMSLIDGDCNRLDVRSSLFEAPSGTCATIIFSAHKDNYYSVNDSFALYNTLDAPQVAGFIYERIQQYRLAINRCYAANTINSSSYHGFCNVNNQTSDLGDNDFWDTEISNSTTAILGATGLTTAQMKSMSGPILKLGHAFDFVAGQYPVLSDKVRTLLRGNATVVALYRGARRVFKILRGQNRVW